MADAFQVMLDSGALWLALGAVVCIVLGVGAVRKMFRGAEKAEPHEPPHHHRH